MLKINGLHVNYGGISAVKGISIHVPEKSIVTLIGANGAGKSTTLKAIAGLVKARNGEIIFQNENILGKDTIDIVVEREKYGKFKFVNLLKRRPVVYKANGIMTRPNSSVIINNIKIKK